MVSYKVFYNFMGSWSKLVNPLWLEKIDFSKFHKVVDVGGGDATNSIALAKAFPNVKITLMDIPDLGRNQSNTQLHRYEHSSELDQEHDGLRGK